jgi:pimeloyl-[acyl-carrier protein] synthase
MMRLIQWLTRQEWLLRIAGPVFGRFNPFLAEHRRDPHATWRRLRSTAPVYRSRVFAAWICTRYDDVLHVLRDRNFTTDRNDVLLMKLLKRVARGDAVMTSLIDRNLLMIDGADHARLRGLVSKAFTPRRVEQLRPRLQTIVDELLDRAAEAGGMEVIGDLAHPLPVTAIAELLGVPTQDRQRFRAWSADLIRLLDPVQGTGGFEPSRRAARELYAYFQPLLAERRADPRDDLLSAMIAAEQDGESLDEMDLVGLSSLLLVAGHETTANLIGNAVVALLRNPGEHKRLQENPELISSAVDELLRYDPPIAMTDRAVREDCEIGGKHIRKGQLVAVVLAAANRDPEHFPDPDRLDLGRPNNHHLTFGQGNHFCLGSQLARLETELAIGSLVRRFPEFTGAPDPPAWRRSMLIRGPESLPLRLLPG